jgi:hypothetical protein
MSEELVEQFKKAFAENVTSDNYNEAEARIVALKLLDALARRDAEMEDLKQAIAAERTAYSTGHGLHQARNEVINAARRLVENNQGETE